MRNLSDACKTCKDNHFDMAMCIDICGIPHDILDEIERKRNEEQKSKMLRRLEADVDIVVKELRDKTADKVERSNI